MKKIINHSVLLLVLACLPAVAQNTATTSGNWDNCATWGNPTSILNVTTDTKTINTGVAIVQNTAWSTNNVSFGTGNGSVSFADAAKSIDFVNDAGADKACTPGVVFNNTSCNLNEANGWNFTGSWYHYADIYRNGGSCLMGGDPNNNSSIGTGMAYKTFATVAGVTYKVTLISRHVGYANTQNSIEVHDGTATSGPYLGRVSTTAGENSFNVVNSFTFTAASATSTILIFEFGGTSYNSDQYIQGVSITY